MFEFLGTYVMEAMEWVYLSYIPDYVLVIVLFTVLLKLFTMPADISQRKSSAKMSGAQVELKKIQDRYKDNPEVMQRKQMEYYKKNGINPYASCLPTIMTLLFFMVFLRAMYQWANVNTINLLLEATKGNYDAIYNSSWLWVHNIWQPDSGMSPVIMEASKFAAIDFKTMIPFFDEKTLEYVKGIAANPDQYTAIMAPVLAKFEGLSNGWFIIPVLAGGTMVLQQWLTKKLNPQMAATPGIGGDAFMYGMAALSVFICVTASTSFSIYWLVSNLAAIAMIFIMRPAKPKGDGAQADAQPKKLEATKQ